HDDRAVLCCMTCKSSSASEAESSSHWAASIRGARPRQPSQVEIFSPEQLTLGAMRRYLKRTPPSQLRSPAIAERCNES
ncbi:hypothetical protein ACEPU1_31055, partial [Pseudomonas aeruginosa]